jgi:hypothetical protein
MEHTYVSVPSKKQNLPRTRPSSASLTMFDLGRAKQLRGLIYSSATAGTATRRTSTSKSKSSRKYLRSIHLLLVWKASCKQAGTQPQATTSFNRYESQSTESSLSESSKIQHDISFKISIDLQRQLHECKGITGILAITC